MSNSPFFRVWPAVALLAVFVAVPAGRAAAQDAAAPAAKPPVVAVIDMGKVSGESLLGKSYAAKLTKLRDEIEAERNKKQADLAKIDAEIKALQEEIEKQAQVLSPDALEKKRQDLTKKARDRQAFVEDGQAEIQRMQERAQGQAQAFNDEFQDKIRPHIEAVVKARGIDILLDSQVTLTLSKDYDVSQDVIVKSDDAERAAGGKTP